MAKKKDEITSTGLERNVAATLAYSVGLVTGILFLIIEKDDKFVRFHAMQSIVTNLIAIIVNWLLIFSIIGIVLVPLWLLFAIIVWVTLMYKAYKDEEYELPYVGKFVKEKIKY